MLGIEQLEARIALNAAPVSVTDSYQVLHGTTLNITASGILGNDSDADQDSLSTDLVSNVAYGSLTLYADGSLDYTPNTSFTGQDVFSYRAWDGTDYGNTVTVTIDVFDAAPVAVDDAFTTAVGQPLVVYAAGVLANDTDADYDSLTASVLVGPLFGTLTFNADGSFSYAPDTSFSGVDTFTYQITDGALNDEATISITVVPRAIDATGTVLFGLEREEAAGLIATFTTDDVWADAEDYSATILWGDEQSSAGVVSGDNGTFTVSASHEYLRRGPYAVVVRIESLPHGNTALAASYAVVLEVEDPAAVQTILDVGLTGSGTINAVVTEYSGGYEIEGTGSYEYALDVSMTDGLYSQVDAAYAGDFAFTFEVAGENQGSLFSLDSYAVQEAGSAGIDRAIVTQDLEGTSTRNEVGERSIVNELVKTYSLTTNESVLTAEYLTALEVEETGVYGGLSYSRSENPSQTTLLDETVNYDTGAYVSDRDESYTVSAWTETGDVYGDALASSGSSSGALALTESGNLFTGVYTVSGEGTSGGTASQTVENAATETTMAWSRDSIDITLLKNGDRSTGAYDLTITMDAENGVGQWSTADLQGTGATAGEQWNNAAWSSSLYQEGNSGTGDYELTVETTNSVSTTGDFENQTASGDTASSGTVMSVVTQSGNVVDGDYELYAHDEGEGSQSATDLENQTATGETSADGSFESELWRSGNTRTGAYSIAQTVTSSGSSSSEGANGDGTNQTYSGTSGVTVSPSSPMVRTTEETGNTLTGEYTSESTTVGAFTLSVNASAGAGAGSAAVETVVTSDPESTFYSFETGNRIDGTYETYQETEVPSFSGEFESSDQDTYALGTISGSSLTVVETSGNLRLGVYLVDETATQSITTTITDGLDGRGEFVSVTTTESESVRSITGNSVTGSYSRNEETTTETTLEKAGDNGETAYAQEGTATSSIIVSEQVNPVTGVYSVEYTGESETTLNEDGDYLGTPFAITTITTAESYRQEYGNRIDGDYTIATAHDFASIETFADGSEGGNSYDFHKVESTETWWAGSGNAIDGSYTHYGEVETGSTAEETNTYAVGGAAFTEILFETHTFVETGNAVTGEYEREEEDGVHTSSLVAETTDAGGTYTVTQSSAGEFVRAETGNRISGDYEKTETAEDIYEVEQTGVGDQNFTLTMTGANAYTDTEEGNAVSGLYVRVKVGIDAYEIEIDGVKSGGTYTQTVSGEEAYTLTDTGNAATGNYERVIEGAGNYERESTGDGATQPTDSDVYDYYWEQVGDPHSGMFDLTVTGMSRYDLLEDFFDISNTQAGQSPGHMNLYPFGQTFVDPIQVAKLTSALQLPPGVPPLTIVDEATLVGAALTGRHAAKIKGVDTAIGKKSGIPWNTGYTIDLRHGFLGWGGTTTYKVSGIIHDGKVYVQLPSPYQIGRWGNRATVYKDVWIEAGAAP